MIRKKEKKEKKEKKRKKKKKKEKKRYKDSIQLSRYGQQKPYPPHLTKHRNPRVTLV